MKLTEQINVVQGIDGDVRINRMPGGFPKIEAGTRADMFFGMGLAHGYDRRMHIWLLKTLIMGRASECFSANPELIEIDTFMRWIRLDRDSEKEAGKLSPEARGLVEAYCQGVNEGGKSRGRPLEFKLTGYHPDEWTPADCLTMVKAAGFAGLAQTQGDMEKFILQMLKNGVSPERVKALFPYIEEEISPELIDIIKKVKLKRPIVSASLAWLTKLGTFNASNNWVVNGKKTASGKPILAGDPHLNIQLPSVWYSMVLKGPDRYLMGATMPGIPALPVGRSNDVAWSVTYAPADVSDNYIEEIKGGQYRQGDAYRDFEVRKETIRPKKGNPIELSFYENERGLLEGSPEEDGYYLNFAWTGITGTTAETLEGFFSLVDAENVDEAMEALSRLTFAPFNWITADRDGNIGYHMSGLVARKKDGYSGLLPLLGWDPDQAWQGVMDTRENPRIVNPPEGFIITANQDLNHFCQTTPIKLPMSEYRADMIFRHLEKGQGVSVDDIKRMHYDLYSIQAEIFMEVLAPLLPDTEAGRVLKDWDRRYDGNSKGAVLFESVYLELVKEVFGRRGFGLDVLEEVVFETNMFAFLHGNFDRILLAEDSVWFDGENREEIYNRAIAKGLKKRPTRYGESRKIYIQHLFFAGKLPKFLGFDYGPYEHVGSRATIPQSQIFRAMGQQATFAPSLRMITDMDTQEIHTNLAGGASDSRFSKYYTNGMANWKNGVYEIFKP